MHREQSQTNNVLNMIYIHNIDGVPTFRAGRGLAKFHSMNLNEIKPIGRDGGHSSKIDDVTWFGRLCNRLEAFSDKLTDTELRQRFVALHKFTQLWIQMVIFQDYLESFIR